MILFRLAGYNVSCAISKPDTVAPGAILSTLHFTGTNVPVDDCSNCKQTHCANPFTIGSSSDSHRSRSYYPNPSNPQIRDASSRPKEKNVHAGDKLAPALGPQNYETRSVKFPEPRIKSGDDARRS